MKTGAIIQARLGARRLPNKVLLKLAGKTVLEHVVNRVMAAKHVDHVVVATTVESNDLKIVKLVSNLGVSVFCGSENDVLDRYYQVAKVYKLDNIVRITADCPVIDPKVIDKVIRYYLKEKPDYCTNAVNSTFPDGQDVEVFSFKALEKCWKKAKLSIDREHVASYINHRKPNEFSIEIVSNNQNYSDKRWTLDEQRDYSFLKVLFKNLYKQNPLFGMKDILAFLKENPEVEKINQNIMRNEGYQHSQKNIFKVK